jgi:Pregnancy-associated plasma protein-A
MGVAVSKMHHDVKGKSRRLHLVIYGGVFSLAVFVGFQVRADAYLLNGCKFSGTNPPILYELHTTNTDWQAAFDQAQASWDNESPGWGGYFAPSTAENIPVYAQSYSASWQGLASGGCNSGGWQIWYHTSSCMANVPCVKIQFNTRTTASSNSTERKNSAVHELGHALGLAHSEKGCSDPAVMRSDANWAYHNCGSLWAPYPNDLAGLDAIY